MTGWVSTTGLKCTRMRSGSIPTFLSLCSWCKNKTQSKFKRVETTYLLRMLWSLWMACQGMACQVNPWTDSYQSLQVHSLCRQIKCRPCLLTRSNFTILNTRGSKRCLILKGATRLWESLLLSRGQSISSSLRTSTSSATRESKMLGKSRWGSTASTPLKLLRKLTIQTASLQKWHS